MGGMGTSDSRRWNLPQVRTAEVVVVGSGIAGLVAALRLAQNCRVTLLTKTAGLESGSSAHAQGGMAVALAPGDQPEDHAADTVAAGAGATDPAMAGLLAREGAMRVAAWIGRGLPFDRQADGSLCFGREAAHGVARILHAGGDATGRTLVQDLIARVQASPAITVQANTFAVDLVVHDGRIGGVLAWQAGTGGGWILHRCPQVILACGGFGAAYRFTTNPPEATGDGVALAARAGAALADMEFVQFHPTALAVTTAGGGMPEGRLPLLTEALRGAGATLLDAQGRRFMPALHPLAELAPRDVVARAVWQQAASGRPARLDLRAIFAGGGASQFPTVAAACHDAGFDPRHEPVPVVPAAHYAMGGVLTDAHGRTSLTGLWACGETACTGVHGANRLASNSLLEALVFGERVAEDIRNHPAAPLAAVAVPQIPVAGPLALAETVTRTVADTLYQAAGLWRDGTEMATAFCALSDLSRQMDETVAVAVPAAAFEDPAAVRLWGEARNRLLVARLVLLAAGRRTESRGAHARRDYPETASGQCQRQILTLADLKTDLKSRRAVVRVGSVVAGLSGRRRLPAPHGERRVRS